MNMVSAPSSSLSRNIAMRCQCRNLEGGGGGGEERRKVKVTHQFFWLFKIIFFAACQKLCYNCSLFVNTSFRDIEVTSQLMTSS